MDITDDCTFTEGTYGSTTWQIVDCTLGSEVSSLESVIFGMESFNISFYDISSFQISTFNSSSWCWEITNEVACDSAAPVTCTWNDDSSPAYCEDPHCGSFPAILSHSFVAPPTLSVNLTGGYLYASITLPQTVPARSNSFYGFGNLEFLFITHKLRTHPKFFLFYPFPFPPLFQ